MPSWVVFFCWIGLKCYPQVSSSCVALGCCRCVVGNSHGVCFPLQVIHLHALGSWAPLTCSCFSSFNPFHNFSQQCGWSPRLNFVETPFKHRRNNLRWEYNKCVIWKRGSLVSVFHALNGWPHCSFTPPHFYPCSMTIFLLLPLHSSTRQKSCPQAQAHLYSTLPKP